MALKKLCSRTGCHRVVDEDKKYCPKHQREFDVKEKERYKIYSNKRLQDKLKKRYQEFYTSSSWKRLRKETVASFFGMDIFEYYTTGRIVAGESVHHIIELGEDWSSRLDSLNLIYLTEQNHRSIHAAYERSTKDKKAMQTKLFQVLDRFHEEFK